ncbi:MAG: DUF2191 domain-containing protein [Candidatus Sumerlaeaceae bacterium]
MKTTIDIADPLFKEAQQIAATEGITFRALVEQSLRSAIRQRHGTPKAPFKMRDASFKGEGINKEFENATWPVIRNLIYGLPPD